MRDIYEDIIASYYSSFLLFKSPTFIKKSELLKRCRLHYVTKLSLADVKGFSYVMDNSEWVISKNDKDALFCFGGTEKQVSENTNRQTGRQAGR